MKATQSNITKKELVDEIASQTGFTQVKTKVIVEELIDAISNSVIEGNNIELRGFGRFKNKQRKERRTRIPKTGELVNIPAKTRPVFEPSKELIEKINNVPFDFEKEAIVPKDDQKRI
ncbi:MAG: integration host factor subunit beta [Fibrobacter sp.]|nr:integration host factor subunit beta [Fibrobacter sp.]MBQ5465413.1 integration host factor subunit beta [Fibrobacter sp.]